MLVKCLGVGNVTESAEFNFYCDPESANIVLTELGSDITMACWELCLKHAFDWVITTIISNLICTFMTPNVCYDTNSNFWNMFT